ncbi:neuromedin-U [Otolemur garnettii]|uniref:neuromedin-U n=1 Tax=Otolemur garnettii TaxID=30611 RepID=UPI000C7EE7C9|nr:neuromedin-U [Otolemur garnettii]
MPRAASRRPRPPARLVAAASPLLLLLLLACCAGSSRDPGRRPTAASGARAFPSPWGRPQATRGGTQAETLQGAGCGALILPQGLQPEQEELQLWNEIADACSPFLSIDYQPQASKVLEELCFALMGILPKPQEQGRKDNTKREEFQSRVVGRSRGYFLFRPRNGRRSAG